MTNIESAIQKLYLECTDRHMDGYYCFEKKKQLLLAKWKIEKLLPKCPTFVGEEEFIKEHQCD